MFPNTSDEEAQSIVFLWRLINFSKNFRYCCQEAISVLKTMFTSNVNFDLFSLSGQKFLHVAMEVGVVRQFFDFGNGLHLGVQERGDILGKLYSLW
jgi:hypothetical protein